jgi:hypothetical protein
VKALEVGADAGVGATGVGATGADAGTSAVEGADTGASDSDSDADVGGDIPNKLGVKTAINTRTTTIMVNAAPPIIFGSIFILTEEIKMKIIINLEYANDVR